MPGKKQTGEGSGITANGCGVSFGSNENVLELGSNEATIPSIY